MISCLIFTKDNADAVTKQIKLVSQYVDEVVVICSDWECKRKIKYTCPFAIIHYMPPVGYVEAYYRGGIDSCRSEWILLLDDDEIPDHVLLKTLQNIDNTEACYYINRFEPTLKITPILRFFHKDAVNITGLIHIGIEPKEGYPVHRLDKWNYIIHKPTQSTSKCKRYARIEAEQYPQIIGHVAKKNKYLQYAYFFVSSIPRVLFAPNRKDLLIYLTYLWKELRKK
jgi:hypothetical protein